MYIGYSEWVSFYIKFEYKTIFLNQLRRYMNNSEAF